MIEVILGVIVFISLLLIIITICSNKFKFALIKIEKADEDIKLYLDRKKDLLKRTQPIIKKELKSKSFLNDIDSENEFNNFQLHDFLKSNYNELLKVLDDNEKLFKSDALVKILEDLNDNEENILGAIKFYNDTVVGLNKLVISFPSNIIAFFLRCNEKEFYNNEKREMFEILNKK